MEVLEHIINYLLFLVAVHAYHKFDNAILGPFQEAILQPPALCKRVLATVRMVRLFLVAPPDCITHRPPSHAAAPALINIVLAPTAFYPEVTLLLSVRSVRVRVQDPTDLR
jgi:hypothetical protein